MGGLDEAVFRLRVAAYARAAYLDGLTFEQHALAELLRRKDGDAAWQELLAMDLRARRWEGGLFHKIGRFWFRMIGR